MQDLSSYESEPGDAGPGATQPAPAQHRVKPMTRSKSESYKGESHLSSAVEARWMPSELIKLSKLYKHIQTPISVFTLCEFCNVSVKT